MPSTRGRPVDLIGQAQRRRDHQLYVPRPRQAVVAILDQGEHHVVASKARHQLDRMPPRHIGVLHALQDMHRTARFDEPTHQQMIAALFELEMLGLVKQLPGKNFVKVW